MKFLQRLTLALFWTLLNIFIGTPQTHAFSPQDSKQESIQSSTQKMTFENRISIIEEKLRGSPTYQNLFGYPLFLEVFEQPASFLDEAASYIKNPNTPSDCRIIACFALQRLSTDQYIAVAESVYFLVEQDLESFDVLMDIVSYPFIASHPLGKDLNNKRVKSLVSKMLQRPGIQESSANVLRRIEDDRYYR